MLKRIITYLLMAILLCFNCAMANFDNFNYAYKDQNNAVDLYKNSVDSMVYVETQYTSGSGVIVKDDGTFITCFHVIADADDINVKLNDGSIYKVNGFRYLNPLNDIAILTLDTTRRFKPISLIPNTNSISIGEKVYTISNPQGQQFTFSDGMISQLSKDNIQFTAPVSHGSSGGALLNQNGYLLGMITSLLRESQNINFALPNESYRSKINNTAIINSKKLKWTDFVIENASEEQFKLFIDYASDNNPYMYYKYMRRIIIEDFENIPKECYTVLGYLALINAIYDGKPDNIYAQDASKFYLQAIEDDVNIEPALLFASWMTIYSNNKDYYEMWLDDLKFAGFYVSYDYMEEYRKQYDLCKTQECYYNLDLELLSYIGSVTNTEGKHSKLQGRNFAVLFKKIVSHISQVTTLNVALSNKDASDYGSLSELYENLFQKRMNIVSSGLQENWAKGSKEIDCGTNYVFSLDNGATICINKFTPFAETHLYIDLNGNKPPNELTIDVNNFKDIYEVVMYKQRVEPYRNIDKILLYTPFDEIRRKY